MAPSYTESINDIRKSIAELRYGQEESVKARAELMTSLARIETLVASLHDTCPHREVIARAANNIVRVEKLESATKSLEETITKDIKEIREAVHGNQLTIAKVITIVVAGGVFGGSIGAGLIQQLVSLIH